MRSADRREEILCGHKCIVPMILAEDEPAVQPASRQSSESDDLPGITAVHRAFRHTGRNDLERKPLEVQEIQAVCREEVL